MFLSSSAASASSSSEQFGVDGRGWFVAVCGGGDLALVDGHARLCRACRMHAPSYKGGANAHPLRSALSLVPQGTDSGKSRQRTPI